MVHWYPYLIGLGVLEGMGVGGTRRGTMPIRSSDLWTFVMHFQSNTCVLQ